MLKMWREKSAKDVHKLERQENQILRAVPKEDCAWRRKDWGAPLKPLETVRDELAVKHSPDDIAGERYDFKAGFDAAVRTLAEGAGEFDEKAADAHMEKWYEEQRKKNPAGQTSVLALCLEAARWQFDQDRARIGLAEHGQYLTSAADNHAIKDLTARAEALQKENARIADLYDREKSRAEQAERERDDYKRGHAQFQRDKLEQVGLAEEFDLHGCDAVEWMADEIIVLRRDLASARAAIGHLREALTNLHRAHTASALGAIAQANAEAQHALAATVGWKEGK